jgi:hypothetical protein
MTVSATAVETSSREAKAMSIGVGIFLLVVGAILTFAVKVAASYGSRTS